MIRVILVDDHLPVRGAMRTLLNKADDIEIVGEAGDGEEAITLVEELVPDVAVMDILMPRMDGIQATQRIQALDSITRVLIVSTYGDPFLIKQALARGASGYLQKGALVDNLVTAVRVVHQGKTFLSDTGRLALDDTN